MLALGLRNLALSIYFGGGLAVISGTRAIFGAADSRKQGGHFSGAVLRSFELLRAAAMLLLFASVILDPREAMVVAALAFLMVGSRAVDRALRKLRSEIGGSTEGLDAADPRRRRFGALHGYSVALLAIQIAVSGVKLALQ